MGVYSFEERYIRFVNADGCHVRTAQKRLTMRQVPSRAFLVLHRTSRLVVILTKLSHLQAVRALGGGYLERKIFRAHSFLVGQFYGLDFYIIHMWKFLGRHPTH